MDYPATRVFGDGNTPLHAHARRTRATGSTGSSFARSRPACARRPTRSSSPIAPTPISRAREARGATGGRPIAAHGSAN